MILPRGLIAKITWLTNLFMEELFENVGCWLPKFDSSSPFKAGSSPQSAWLTGMIHRGSQVINNFLFSSSKPLNMIPRSLSNRNSCPYWRSELLMSRSGMCLDSSLFLKLWVTSNMLRKRDMAGKVVALCVNVVSSHASLYQCQKGIALQSNFFTLLMRYLITN